MPRAACSQQFAAWVREGRRRRVLTPCAAALLMCRFGAGNTFWSVNIDDLAQKYNVYAVDWRGCGASTRERFTVKEAMEAEDWFVQGLVRWREAHPHKAHTLDKFIIVAHSMGAMIAAKCVGPPPPPASPPSGPLLAVRRAQCRGCRAVWVLAMSAHATCVYPPLVWLRAATPCATRRRCSS